MFLSVQNYCKYIELQNEKAIFLIIQEANDTFNSPEWMDSLDSPNSMESPESVESVESLEFPQKYEPHGILVSWDPHYY